MSSAGPAVTKGHITHGGHIEVCEWKAEMSVARKPQARGAAGLDVGTWQTERWALGGRCFDFNNNRQPSTQLCHLVTTK